MDSGIFQPEQNEEESKIEQNLRPQSLTQYIGQDRIKETLKIYI